MAFVSCHWKKVDEDNLRDFYLLPLFIFVLRMISLLLSFGCSSNHLIPTAIRSSLNERIPHDVVQWYTYWDHIGSLFYE